jgi:CubicO group peptidase (beta-lactamase class C family)
MNRTFPGRRRFAAGLAILALAALPASSPAQQNDLAALAAYTDKLLAETYPAGEPGAAALIVKDGKTLLRKGYGLANLELGVPIQPDMVFEIGSVTKQFTAAAILLLAERGQLSIDDEITKYLSDYPTHGQKITIHHLLTHTSGIPSYTGLPEWLPRVREDLKVEQLVAMFKDKPLEFAPGERWVYNNSAYILLGAVIEKVSGRTYEDFIEQEIFKPLGMTRSSYGHNDEVVPGRVDGYDKMEDGYRRARYLSMTQPYAAGALLSTVDDLARWSDALWGGKVLKPESLKRMLTPATLASGSSTRYAYGLGVSEYAGRTFVEHGGGIFGFVCDTLRIPDEGLFIAILSNNPAQAPQPEALAFRIAAKALGQPLESRQTQHVDAQALDEYVGVYRLSPDEVRVITRDGDRLFSQRSGGEKREVKAIAKDRFAFDDWENELQFRRDAQGKIAGVNLQPRFGADEPAERTNEPPPAERQAVQVDPALFDAYAGTYELAPGFELTISREGNQIFAQATGQPKAEIFPESETKFFLKVVDAQLVFEKGENGRAESLVLHQGGREIPGKRVK